MEAGSQIPYTQADLWPSPTSLEASVGADSRGENMRRRRTSILLALVGAWALTSIGASADDSKAAVPVTVNWATADGTATAGQDYVAASGTLTFSPGETQKTISVTVSGDVVPEPNETFRVVLSGAVNASIADGDGLGTIEDDDGWAGVKGFRALPPCRVIDTRNATQGPAIPAATAKLVTIAANCGIPDDAMAIAVNVAVVGATKAGYLTLYPAGTTMPQASTINFKASQVRGNNAVVKVGAGGQISVYSGLASGSVHVIIDVAGYFEQP